MALFKPFDHQMGAELVGVDLAEQFDPKLYQAILAELDFRRVVVVRNQSLTPARHVEVMRAFGALETHPVHPGQPLDLPEIFRVANDPQDGFTNVGRYWHTDGGARVRPTRFVSLYGVAVSETDGRTDFLDMQTVYRRLPADLRARITDRDTKRIATGVRHPLVRAHPETGEPLLFLPTRIPSRHVPDPSALNSSHPLFNSGPDGWDLLVDGLDEAASDALLTELAAHVDRASDAAYAHRWRQGDLVIWDNAALYHHAFLSDHPRILNRVSVKGEKAVAFGAAETRPEAEAVS